MKKENWPELLAQEIRKAKKKEFIWGEFDCTIWVADMIKTLKGIDFAKDFRGTYSTKAGAYKVIKEHGCENVEQLATTYLGKPRRINKARRGDVVSDEFNGEYILGICMGKYSWFLNETVGLVSEKTINCRKSWRY